MVSTSAHLPRPVYDRFIWSSTRRFTQLMRSFLSALAFCSFGYGIASQTTTMTVYVGKHFEIRDHEQPTKYVFSGETRVAEVTGSISTNMRVQRLRLYPGWNLCSLAVSGTFPGDGAEAISAAYQWNQGTADYSPISPGQTLAAGTVLWVKAKTNGVVSVVGQYANPVPTQVAGGGSYIHGAGLESWSPALPQAVAAWDFDASTGQWLEQLTGNLAALSGPPPTLSPGDALYLQAAADVSLDMPDPAVRVRYYHQDHLGSSSAVTDANGTLVEEVALFPFGVARNELRPRHIDEPYQFTQKERDLESRLHYFETRYLAGHLARFVTPDLKHACPDRFPPEELGSWLSVPQQLNLYAYVRNNPLRYIDPLGQDPSKPKIQPQPPPPEAPVTLTLNSGGSEITIPISSMQWGGGRQTVPPSGAEAPGRAKQSLHELVLTRTFDETSPELMRKALGADPASSAMNGEIVFRRTVGGHSEVYLRIKLKSVIISGYSIGGKGKEASPTENITLNATEIEFEPPTAQPVENRQGAVIPSVLRNRYYQSETPAAPMRGYEGPEQFMFSTGRPAERQAAESCGACATYP